jgi:hypothetical protein
MKEEPKEILTVSEIAGILRCSKAHVERALEGSLSGIPRMAHLLVESIRLCAGSGYRSGWKAARQARCSPPEKQDSKNRIV